MSCLGVHSLALGASRDDMGHACRALGSGMTPIAEMADHRHWVWQSKFSPHHSQMVLSSSSGAC